MLRSRISLASRVIRPAFGGSSQMAVANYTRRNTLRFYASGPAPLTRDSVQERILELMGNFDRVDPSKLSPNASFRNDLGLDSLDIVDVLFYIEEEFSVQMPDHEANAIKSVDQAVEWVLAQPDSF